MSNLSVCLRFHLLGSRQVCSGHRLRLSQIVNRNGNEYIQQRICTLRDKNELETPRLMSLLATTLATFSSRHRELLLMTLTL